MLWRHRRREVDYYWRRNLDTDRLNSRIDGAFDRANRASLTGGYRVRKWGRTPDEALSATMSKMNGVREQSAKLSQMRDYLFEQYGADAVFREDLQEALGVFRGQSVDNIPAVKLIERLLVSNSTRAEHWAAQVAGSKFGPGEQIGNGLAEFVASKEAVDLASEFLGLQDLETDQQRPHRSLREVRPDRTGKSSRLPLPEVAVPQPKPGVGIPRSKPIDHGETVVPRSRSRTNNNPFDVQKPKLKQQAEMLERNPAGARQMIKAAGRDPELFGL